MKKKIRLVFLCAVVALCSFDNAYGALNTTLFTRYIPITVSGYTGESPLENFPVLVTLEANSPSGFNYAACAVDGSDLRFADSEGNLIPHEIDTWNTAGKSLIWVGLPVLTNGVAFTMYYGAEDPGIVSTANLWSLAGYAGVWHLTDGHDSSASGLNGTIVDGIAAVADAKLGGALYFDKVKMSVGMTHNGDFTNGFSLTGWCCPKSTGTKALFGKADAMSVRIEGESIKLTTPRVKDHAAVDCDIKAEEWFHFGVTFSRTPGELKNLVGTGYKVYRDGIFKNPPGKGTTDIFDLTSVTNMWLGGNQWKGQEFEGILDEFRLSYSIRSADWIKAAYDTAAAPASFVTLGAAKSLDATAPDLATPIVVRNQDGSFTVSVVVSQNVPASIVCEVGGADIPMTTTETSLPATYAAIVSSVAPGTYQATVRAEASSGTIVVAACPTIFHIGALTVTKLSDADEMTLKPGVFRIARADADSTGLPPLTFDVNFAGDALVAIVSPGVDSLTIPAGEAYVDISIVPAIAKDINHDVSLVLTVSGDNISETSSAEMTVINTPYNPAIRYVATTGSDENHGGTPEFPKKSIAAAVASLDSVARSQVCTVHVAEGKYSILAPITITNAIRILGAASDPLCTVVSNRANVSYGAENRVFTIQNAQAEVSNLTMEHGRIVIGNNKAGGILYMSAGVVSNCVIRDGLIEQRSSSGAFGGGVEMKGTDALLTHCVITNCRAKATSASWASDNACAGVYVSAGRVENCLLVDCFDDSNSITAEKQTGGIVLAGANAKAVNCTVIRCVGSRAGGITVANNSAVAKNCVALNCTRRLKVNEEIVTSVVPFSGTATLFDHCASDATETYDANESMLNLTAGAFKDYANGDYTPKAGGPLVGKGVDYEGMAAVDLAGKPRKVGKRIDIGCYEAQSSAFIITVR